MLQDCDPVWTRLKKLSDLPLQVHNPVVNRLRGLDPVHPQLRLIEIYRLVVNVDVRVVDARRQGEDAVPEGARHCDSRREYPAEARPPPALLDERGELYYHVERLVARCRRQGRTQYLVKLRGYPHSQNSWEFQVPLREDHPDVVDAYDLAHPLPKRHHGV
ncbi:hypothetical protein PC129_g9788 [Phytophthora cactorum]|uniref:Chromo domain-containing protein n=1 Tax=Phytophthora cactorum TaxID=29920 RepID=A0A329SJB6_9STRA|nr:hypothetical protein Pcac1_g16992 [Phytophthora cactorum]KAG2835695.1 hypothetical protein PC112_g5579 [Phytophthora cactorum]KAG2838868.1 hypothetical protein PC111_g4082 [Phytophthora cactorum]KAG2862733.1 hypothetical protein PC113_g6020 [Phytophthora cactorum]KAG2920142.1 hypothetical protein PC114_g6211 [Phytophthora cactorum]